MFCGGGEIRTLDTLSSMPPFQGGGINRYPTPPISTQTADGSTITETVEFTT